MCKCASFVITQGPRVWWLPKSDRHNDIIEGYKLNADGARGPNTVSVEISPPGGDLSLPLEGWVYKTDQDQLPAWYDAAACESATRLALQDWAAAKLTGWNVREAFHPVNPLLITRKKFSRKKLEGLIDQWASVRNSVWANVGTSVLANVGTGVWDGVWDSVRASVWDSVWSSVGDSVRDSVWSSVRASVRNSVLANVGASVRNSVLANVGASVMAYIGGLYPNITTWRDAEKLGPDPWRPLLTLWYAGYVPSFDGKVWRLHAGKDAKIVLEYAPKEGK